MNTAVVIGVSGLFYQACVLLTMLKDSLTIKHDLIVYQSGLSDTQKDILKDIYNVSSIIEYSSFKDTKHYTTNLAYSKLECLKLLGTYDKVLWLDIDLLIRKNIDDLFNYSEFICAAYNEKDMSVNFYDGIPKLNYLRPLKDVFFNSGVVLFNDVLEKSVRENIYAWSTDFLRGGIEQGRRVRDQGILNLVPYLFEVKTKCIDPTYNMHVFCIKELKNSDPAIYHYASPEGKPYYKEYITLCNEQVMYPKEYVSKINETLTM